MASRTILEASENLPPDVPDERRELVAKYYKGGRVTICTEKQAGYGEFLYLMGHSYEEIAKKLNVKEDVVYLSSSYFRWYEKKQIANSKNEVDAVSRVIKNVLNAMLAGSAAEVEAEMVKIATGEIDYNEAKFLPKNIRELQNLMAMVKEAHAIVESDPYKKSTNPVNVLINNHATVSEAEVKKIEADSEKNVLSGMTREERLKAMLEGKK